MQMIASCAADGRDVISRLAGIERDLARSSKQKPVWDRFVESYEAMAELLGTAHRQRPAVAVDGAGRCPIH